MALLFGGRSPQPSRPPISRYAVSNPLRREGGIRLLIYHVPEPLRSALVSALRRPPLFDGRVVDFAVQHLQRSHPTFDDLADVSLRGKAAFVRVEVEVARRIIEAPQGSITRGERNALLMAQGLELRFLYLVLIAQIGPHGALALFQQALDAMG